MTELLTAAQMRAIEQAAIESGEVTGLELMERAGRGVVEAIFEEWPELKATSHRAVVLCGPGNNGGDGFVVARLLKEWGWEVEVFLYGDAEKLPPDARVNYERWGNMGAVLPLDYETLHRAEGATSQGNLVIVDALFGTGLQRPMNASVTHLLDSAGSTGGFAFSRRVSIDLPSGLCADSGRGLWQFEPTTVEQRLTVTFHRPKLGHYVGDHRHLVGKLACVGIGLEDRPRPERGGDLSPPPWGAGRGRSGADAPEDSVFLAEPDLDELRKSAGSHKYAHGHAVILAPAVPAKPVPPALPRGGR